LTNICEASVNLEKLVRYESKARDTTIPIYTDRLILRRFLPADAADLRIFIDHPSVARSVPEMASTEAGVRSYIEQQNSFRPFEQDQCFDLAIEHIQDSRIIGWALGFEYRSRGYAT